MYRTCTESLMNYLKKQQEKVKKKLIDDISQALDTDNVYSGKNYQNRKISLKPGMKKS